MTDALNHLADRKAFDVAFKKAVAVADQAGASASVAVVDVDLLGHINSAQGRDCGDDALVHVAECLGAIVSDRNTLYRFGGDAFSVILPDTEKEQAFLVLEEVRKALEVADSNGLGQQVQISAGLASYPDDGSKAKGIVHKANEALYRAKVSGRNKICLAREEKMVTKTSHYMQGQLMGLRRLAERESISESVLLREALNDLLRKYNS